MNGDAAAARLAPVTEPDVGALRSFYDDVFDEVYRYAIRLTGGDAAAAEDLVHEAFVGLVCAWRDGRVDRLEIGWVVTVTRQRFLDGLRRRSREARRLQVVAAERPPAEVDPTDAEGALTLLARLPDRMRAALVLRYVDDLAVPGVAAAMGLSIHATESLLARGRARLRLLIEEQHHG